TGECLCSPFGRRNDKDRVVPGERADDSFVLELIERTGDRRRRAELRLEHHDIARRRELAPELTEDRIENLGAIRSAGSVSELVSRPAEVVLRLLETQPTTARAH